MNDEQSNDNNLYGWRYDWPCLDTILEHHRDRQPGDGEALVSRRLFIIAELLKGF